MKNKQFTQNSIFEKENCIDLTSPTPHTPSIPSILPTLTTPSTLPAPSDVLSMSTSKLRNHFLLILYLLYC